MFASKLLSAMQKAPTKMNKLIPPSELSQLPDSKEKRDRLKAFQNKLIVTRIEDLLKEAKAGNIDGILVVVSNADLSPNAAANQFLFLDGKYAREPANALSALQHGVSALFTTNLAAAAALTLQLSLDLNS